MTYASYYTILILTIAVCFLVRDVGSLARDTSAIRHQLEDCNNIAQSESVKAMPTNKHNKQGK